ncbi:metallophosphoesterase, partial [Acinetobacter variabilis]
GEIDALNSLLHVMGYNLKGEHPEQRKLIFVGDLCDRGQNSVAVIQQVKILMERAHAYCVLGNHELNLLNQSYREGNGW